MGAVYSIYAECKFKDSKKAYKELRGCVNEMTEYHEANFGEMKMREKGVNTRTIKGLLQLVFAGWGFAYKSEEKEDGTIYVENDFDASYGWEWVMRTCFKSMEKYLEDGSYLEIWPDNDHTLLTVRNGHIVEE